MIIQRNIKHDLEKIGVGSCANFTLFFNCCNKIYCTGSSEDAEPFQIPLAST